MDKGSKPEALASSGFESPSSWLIGIRTPQLVHYRDRIWHHWNLNPTGHTSSEFEITKWKKKPRSKADAEWHWREQKSAQLKFCETHVEFDAGKIYIMDYGLRRHASRIKAKTTYCEFSYNKLFYFATKMAAPFLQDTSWLACSVDISKNNRKCLTMQCHCDLPYFQNSKMRWKPNACGINFYEVFCSLCCKKKHKSS